MTSFSLLATVSFLSFSLQQNILEITYFLSDFCQTTGTTLLSYLSLQLNNSLCDTLWLSAHIVEPNDQVQSSVLPTHHKTWSFVLFFTWLLKHEILGFPLASLDSPVNIPRIFLIFNLMLPVLLSRSHTALFQPLLLECHF